MKLTTHLHLVLRHSLRFSRHVSVLNTENFYIIKSFQLAYKRAKTTKHHLKHHLLTYRFIVIRNWQRESWKFYGFDLFPTSIYIT
jgi:hypothetical protein